MSGNCNGDLSSIADCSWSFEWGMFSCTDVNLVCVNTTAGKSMFVLVLKAPCISRCALLVGQPGLPYDMARSACMLPKLAGAIKLSAALRLTNGTSRSGRLEMLMGGEWVGVVVPTASSAVPAVNRESVATQACRVMGLMDVAAPTATAMDAWSTFGPPSSQRWAQVAYCQGNEDALADCNVVGLQNVSTTGQLAVSCPTPERAHNLASVHASSLPFKLRR